MKENLKSLGLGLAFLALAMLCLWGMLLIAKSVEDQSMECTAKGGEILYYRCVDTIELERK